MKITLSAKAVVLALAAILLTNSTLSASGAKKSFVIENANIVDVEGGRILRNRSLRIDRGMITAIGMKESVRPKTGDRVLDAAGKYLMPGLIDIHVHLDDTPDDLTLFLNYGVTTIRSLDGTPDHVGWKKAVAAGKLHGPTVFTSGPILYGSRGDFDGEIWSSTEDVNEAARIIVNKHVETGYDAVKVYYQLSADQYDALVAAAKKAGLPVVGHVPYAKTIAEIMEAGQVTNEHMSGFDKEMVRPESKAANTRTAWGNMLRLTEIDDEKMARFMKGMGKYKGKHWVTTTVIIYDVFNRPDFVNSMLADEKMMGMLSPRKRENWSRFNRFQVPHFNDQSEADKKVMKATTAELREWIKAFYDSGVGVALGTDGGGRWAYPGLSSQQEVEIYVDAGLRPLDALKIATVNSAAALGQSKTLGQIAEGFRADIVMTGRNPLDDITAIRDIQGIMARGNWHSREDLDQRLEALYEKRKSPKVFGDESFYDGEVFRGSFAPDGKTFYFFRKIVPDTEQYRIFRSTLANGRWSVPEAVDLGGEYSDLYPAISPDGKRMVFASYRKTPGDNSKKSNAHLWLAEKDGDGWSEPVFLESVNRLGHYHAWAEFGWGGALVFRVATPDWSATETLVADWNGRGFETPRPFAPAVEIRISDPDLNLAGVSPGPTEDIVFLDVGVRDPISKKSSSDIWISRRKKDRWSAPCPLGNAINTGGFDVFPFFSPNGETMYFVRDFKRFYSISLADVLKVHINCGPAGKV